MSETAPLSAERQIENLKAHNFEEITTVNGTIYLQGPNIPEVSELVTITVDPDGNLEILCDFTDKLSSFETLASAAVMEMVGPAKGLVISGEGKEGDRKKIFFGFDGRSLRGEEIDKLKGVDINEYRSMVTKMREENLSSHSLEGVFISLEELLDEAADLEEVSDQLEDAGFEQISEDSGDTGIKVFAYTFDADRVAEEMMKEPHLRRNYGLECQVRVLVKDNVITHIFKAPKRSNDGLEGAQFMGLEDDAIGTPSEKLVFTEGPRKFLISRRSPFETGDYARHRRDVADVLERQQKREEAERKREVN